MNDDKPWKRFGKTTPEGADWTPFNRWYYKGVSWSGTRTGKALQRKADVAAWLPTMKEARRLLEDAKGQNRSWKEVAQLCEVDYGAVRKWLERMSVIYVHQVARMLMVLGKPIPWKYECDLEMIFQTETWIRAKEPHRRLDNYIVCGREKLAQTRQKGTSQASNEREIVDSGAS